MGVISDFVFIQVPNKLTQPLMYPFSLSLLYLAAVLEKAGATVAIADLRDQKSLDISSIPCAKYYGFTATTPEYQNARKLVKMLKMKYPKAVTIIGGAHSTALPEECLPAFNIVAVNEWDNSVTNFLKPNPDEGIVLGDLVNNLDSIPFPARHLAGDRAFSTTLMPGEFHGEGSKAAMLISSRGCPYGCVFCASARTLPVRFRSPENVAAEVNELVYKYKVRSFRDESDNLMLHKDWFLKLCGLLRPFKVSWKGHSRSTHITEELLEAAKEAGVVEMGLGVESADPTVLELVGKGETVEDHEAAVTLLKKAGILSKVYLMGGLPGETNHTLSLNLDFMKKVKPDKWTLSKFSPLPGSEVWKNPSKYGANINKDSYDRSWFFFEGSSVEYVTASAETLNSRYKRMFYLLMSEEWKKE